MVRITPLLAVAVAAIVVASGIGVGYALVYTGVVDITGNNSDSDVLEVDVLSGNTSASSPITFPAYSPGQTGTISGYKLKVNNADGAGADVTLWFKTDKPGSWALISSIKITVNATSTITKTYTLPTSNSTRNLNPCVNFTVPNGTWSFTITVTFSNIPYTVDSQGNDLSDFTNSVFFFKVTGRETI